MFHLHHNDLIARFVSSCFFALLFLAGTTSLHAQYGQTAQDGQTPPNLEQGAPAGAYALSGFENINHYNGSLNIALPLMQMGGRGGSGFGITLKIDEHVGIYRYVSYGSNYGQDLTWSTGGGWRVGYGPGVLIGKWATNHPQDGAPLNCGGYVPNYEFNTRLYFTTPDGTEIQLHDKLYSGSLYARNPCTATPGSTRNRGKVFVSADGESATFISTTDISDNVDVGAPSQEFFPTGMLLLSNGTRYRIDSGKISWMRDRNGNKTSFTYETLYGGYSWRMLTATDSLNRQVAVTYNDTLGNYDEIAYRGYGGAARSIKVWHDAMSNALRPDFTIQQANELFPEVYDAYNIWSGDWDFDMPIVSKVELPDGRTYQFFYNDFGEVARVLLPTGGGTDYEYTPGYQYSGGGYASSLGLSVLRRLTKRTTYNALTATTSHSSPPSGTVERIEKFIKEGTWSASPTVVRIETRAPDSSETLLAQSKVYYGGTGVDSALSTLGAASYSPWLTSKEYKSEAYNVVSGSAGSALRVTETNWGPSSSCDCPAPNPHIDSIVTTLADTNQVTKQTFSYDSYNNKTDVYEYDYGATAPPSGYLRHTQTAYLTSGYDTISGGTSSPDPDATIHLRNLPTQTKIYDGGDVLRSQTSYEYDNYNQSSSDVFHAGLVDRSSISGLVSRSNQTPGGSYSPTTDYLRGNVTKTTQSLLNTSGTETGTISSYAQYDIAGNVVKTLDPRSTTSNLIATTFEFNDRFGSPDGNAQNNDTLPSPGSGWLGSQVTFAFPTKVTNALGHIAYMQFDYFLGKPVDTEDPNNIKASVYYNDALDRPTKSIRAVGNSLANQTLITYDDTNRITTVAVDKDSNTDGVLVSKSLYDGLGRTKRKAVYEAASQWTITETQFDAVGRIWRTCNPFRGSSITASLPSSPDWTKTEYDALSRVIKVTTPDDAHVDTFYDGNQVLVYDQASKQRMSETDALGRLKKVWEIRSADSTTGTVSVSFTGHSGVTAGYLTTYTYNVLDDLTTVTQQIGTSGTTQTRTFAYDALKRLTSATNPESGTTSYTYYNNGALNTKTDARSVVTTMAYDAIGRPTSKTYTGISSPVLTTPNVYYYYDSDTLPSGAPSYTRGSSTGRLVAVTYGSSSSTSEGNYFAYDALGRVTSKYQRTGTQNYQTQASYNLAGAKTGETYPSGHTVSYAFDAAGRLSTFAGNLGGGGSSANYINATKYNAASQMIREDFNTTTALYHRIHYNNRHQAYDIRVGDSNSTTYDSENPNDWQYSTGSWNRGALRLYYAKDSGGNYVVSSGGLANNGNLLRMDHFVPADTTITTWSMSVDEYTYDALNRVEKVWETAQTPSTATTPFQQAFSYDRYGNRTIDQANTWVKDGTVYVEDALPTGATGASDGGDSWNWVTSSPTAYSGTSSSQSNTASGMHQHYFTGATSTMSVATGDKLYAYIYLDPTNPPTEVMLQWNDGSSWEHRAYWGANSIGWGTNGTTSRRYMGALPATGRWVRLEVAASQVGLEGVTVSGMAFTLYDGKATWDRAGKSGLTNGGINAKPYTASATTNQLQSPTSSITYDNAGNMISDSYTNPDLGTHKYDAENRLGEVYSFGATLNATYVYNGEGQRVKRVLAGETWQVYGIGGELIAEYASNTAASSPQKEYGYRGGQLLISAGSNSDVKYLVLDHLGSTRMVIDKSGRLTDDTSTTTINEAVNRHDYLPFGEELVGVGIRSGFGGDGLRQKFTGYERDVETGLDFAQARYYASVQGRFTSPDPMLSSGNVGSPQTWNRYVYTSNNPLKYIDPLGLYNFGASLGGNRSDADIQNEINNLDIDKDYVRIQELQGMLAGRQAFRDALFELEMIASTDFSLRADQQEEISRALQAYGTENDNNGVSIVTGVFRPGVGAQAEQTQLNYGPNGQPTGALYEVRIGRNVSASELVMQVAHEGSHIADERDALSVWIATGRRAQAVASPLNVTGRQTENRAYRISAAVAEGQGRDSLTMGAGFTIWRKGMEYVDQQTLDALLQRHYTDAGRDLGRRRIQ